MNHKTESATPVLDDLRARELEILDGMATFIFRNRVCTAIRLGVPTVTIRVLNSVASAYATNRQTQTDEIVRLASQWGNVS